MAPKTVHATSPYDHARVGVDFCRIFMLKLRKAGDLLALRMHRREYDRGESTLPATSTKFVRIEIIVEKGMPRQRAPSRPEVPLIQTSKCIIAEVNDRWQM